MSESLADVVHEAVERAKSEDRQIDPAAIMAEHHDSGRWDTPACAACPGDSDTMAQPWPCEPYLLAAALAASQARPVVVRSVVRGFRRYWLIDGLEAHAVWVTRQLPDPSEWVQPNALGHLSRSCVDGDVPGEDCDCR